MEFLLIGLIEIILFDSISILFFEFFSSFIILQNGFIVVLVLLHKHKISLVVVTEDSTKQILCVLFCSRKNDVKNILYNFVLFFVSDVQNSNILLLFFDYKYCLEFIPNKKYFGLYDK